jgi:two-component system, OmpR family, KDP operon response regulator KdpE
MHSIRIMIVDDDISTTELLKSVFECDGYDAFVAHNVHEAEKAVTTYHPDLILLDLMMPHQDGSNGISFLRELRQNTDCIPVIILSAIEDLNKRITLLNIGADDYLTKPFDNNELIARVNSVLRRSTANNSLVQSWSSGDLSIDFDAQRVTRGGKEIRLSKIEYRLFEELTRNTGCVLSYKQLLSRVWDPTYENNKEYLHVYVNCLRKKLEMDPKNPRCIINIPGRGYRFDRE